MAYITRWGQTYLDFCLSFMKVVLIAGPRQCGKTTLMRHVLDENQDVFVSLDSTGVAEYVRSAPAGFLADHKQYRRVALDEVQKVPDLFSEIKYDVDQSDTAGRYLMTGSASFHAMPTVNESLAGRLGLIRLRTLTEGEIQGNPPRFIERILTEDFSGKGLFACTKSSIIEKALKGGYPGLIGKPSDVRKNWFDFYVNSLIDHDLKDVSNIRKKHALNELLVSVASYSSKLLVIKNLGDKLSLNRETMLQYLGALEALYLVDKVPAWTRLDYDRIGRSPKVFVTDSGLMAALLGFSHHEAVFKDVIVDADFTGKLVETWVYCQLAGLLTVESDWKLNHFRTRDGHEIDFLLENRRGDLIGIEVKAGEKVSASDFKHMDWFREKIAGQRRFTAVLLYAGDAVRRFGEQRFAVPFAMLWS